MDVLELAYALDCDCSEVVSTSHLQDRWSTSESNSKTGRCDHNVYLCLLCDAGRGCYLNSQAIIALIPLICHDLIYPLYPASI